MSLEKRWSCLIKEAGGALALLNLPAPVRDGLKNTTDLSLKVKILESYLKLKR